MRVELAYTDRAGCRLAASFPRQFFGRTERAQLAAGDASSVAITVTIARDGANYRGELVLAETGEPPAQRELTGASCEEVIAALGLIAAVFVDPNARTEAKLPDEPAPNAPTGLPPERRDASRWWFGATVDATLDSAVAPELVPGVAVGFEALVERRSVLSPLFSLSLRRTATGHASASGGVAALQATLMRSSACPLRLPGTGPLAARPCVFLDAGAVHAVGTNTTLPAERTSAWLAPGVSLRAELLLLGHLVVSAEGGAAFPLLRQGYYFDPLRPESRAFYVPSVAGTARLGVGGRF